MFWLYRRFDKLKVKSKQAKRNYRRRHKVYEMDSKIRLDDRGGAEDILNESERTVQSFSKHKNGCIKRVNRIQRIIV